MTKVVVVDSPESVSIVEVIAAGPAGPPGGTLTIQDQGVDEGLLTDKINFAGSTVSVVNDTEAEIATVTVNAADPGANTNITSLGGITGGISSPDYVQFDTAAAAAGAVGRLLWNDTDGTLEFQLKGGNVTLQIGQEQVIRVTNTAGVTMTDGQAVYITGSTGNHLNVTLAQANAEATSSKTLAVVTETIANNNTGFATSSGLVRGLDTSALTEGAAIWLSPTVPGGLTTTRPTAPDHAVLIGWCVRQHASVGVIYVHIANGYELEELHNVLITAAANNQVLRYDAATGLWKNATISPTLTLTGDVSGSATFTDLGNATLTATVADDSHNHIISNVDGLQTALDSKFNANSTTDALTEGSTNLYFTTARVRASLSAGTGISYDSGTGVITNAAPDQTVSITGSGTTTVTGTYPNFTVTSADQYVGTVTSVDAIAGTGISVSGGPITSSGSITITNTAPDQIVALTGTGTTSVTGTYPNFTINSADQYVGTVTSIDLTAGTGISVSGGPITSSGSITVTNTAPDQVVSITGAGTTSVTGTYPNFTVSSADQYVGTVTSVSGTGTVNGLTLTGTVTSSGSLTLGGTLSVDLSTSTVTGTLPVTKGGTGATSLTANYLLKGNGTSSVSASVVYDNGTNVGIGTNSPNAQVHVSFSPPVSVPALGSGVGVLALGPAANYGMLLGTISDGSGYIQQQRFDGTTSVYPLALQPNGGNVGIGTSLPSSKFVVSNGGAAGFEINPIGSASAPALYSYNRSTSAYDILTTLASEVRWQTGASPSERMRIDSSGQVGIGTTSPVTKLDVRSGYITAGTATSTEGSKILGGYYSSGNIATFGGERSNGGPVIGYGVWPSPVAEASFVSATGINVARGAYTMVGNVHKWFAGGAQTVAVDSAVSMSEVMRIDSAGNVGIGTSSPSSYGKLAVLGNIVATTEGATILTMRANAGVTNLGSYNATGSYLAFQTNASGSGEVERMRITSSGNVGIGTSSPSVKLDVSGGHIRMDDGYKLRWGDGTAAWEGSGASDVLIGYTNNTERMRIDSSGNVGIGTTSPGSKLDVRGNFANTFPAATSSQTNIGAISGVSNGYQISADTSNNLVYTWRRGTNDVAMTLDASGNLLVGTTSSYTLGKSAFYETTTNYWPIATRGVNRGLAVDITASSGVAMYFTTSSGGNYAGEISINGTSTNYATSSDARLKHDIVDAPEASSLIDAIKVRSFKWNADNSEQRYGMVAQELLEVAPEAVSVPADEEAMMGVDYSKLVPMLVKEIQSLRARVAQLEGN